jgi:hypothetical protein
MGDLLGKALLLSQHGMMVVIERLGLLGNAPGLARYGLMAPKHGNLLVA